MDKPLQRIMAGMLDDLAALMDARDFLGPTKWDSEFKRIIIERNAAAYFAGNGNVDLTPFMDRQLGALMQQQLDYLQGFAAVVDDLSPAQAKARAALYAGALKTAYSQGQNTLWDLPVYPGQSSPCRTNCKCEWKIEVLDLEELHANAYWRLGSGEHCDVCVARAARYNPLRIREGVAQ